MVAQSDLDADLDAGVAQGIITDAQAAALRALAAEREKVRAAALGHEERFRFMRGFNDFFFASGVLLFGFGVVFFAEARPIGNLIAAVMMWALAELLVGRMRLVLPGILLALFLVRFIYMAVPPEWLGIAPAMLPARGGWFGSPSWYDAPLVPAVKGLAAAAAALAFYARFRLPFALLPLAGGLVLAVSMVARLVIYDDTESVDSAVLLSCGLAVFAAAMAFDVSDRERVTRRADCAFWLHLLAAPLIVHSLIALTTTNPFRTMTDQVAATIVAIVLALAAVAIVIDRRALLVSTLAYLGIVISYGIRGTTLDQSAIFFGTLLVLGTIVLTIGVGWLPLRRQLMRLFSGRLAAHLPPVAPA
jgi:hypothetical protein